MNKISDDFVSSEKKAFKWQVGKVNASSLSGFIAGFLVATVFFLALFNLTAKTFGR